MDRRLAAQDILQRLLQNLQHLEKAQKARGVHAKVDAIVSTASATGVYQDIRAYA